MFSNLGGTAYVNHSPLYKTRAIFFVAEADGFNSCRAGVE